MAGASNATDSSDAAVWTNESFDGFREALASTMTGGSSTPTAVDARLDTVLPRTTGRMLVEMDALRDCIVLDLEGIVPDSGGALGGSACGGASACGSAGGVGGEVFTGTKTSVPFSSRLIVMSFGPGSAA